MFVMPLRRMHLRWRGLESSYGASYGYVRKYRKTDPSYTKAHQGWDLDAKIGTPCYAISGGVITHTGYHRDFGWNIVLMFSKSGQTGMPSRHPLWAFYAHLSSIWVARDQIVDAGEPIGLTGATGNADPSAPHLHFEVRNTSNPNPGKGFVGRLDPAAILGYQYLMCSNRS